MKSKRLILLYFSFACGAILSCQSDKEETQATRQEIVLKNPASIALTEKGISVEREKLKEIQGDLYPLVQTMEGDTIPSQLDDLDADRQWDELFFVIDLPARAEKTLTLSWVETMPDYTKRTSIRFGKRNSESTPVQPKTSDTLNANELPKSLGYQPYQTDGPTWENDKVGFRHYFDGRNAKDLFGKKVSYITPENVGLNANGAVEDNYHVMEEWGRDVLAVGNSMGIGGIALLKGDSLLRLGVTVDDSINNVEKTTLNVLTEGPVRSIFEINYLNWHPINHSYDVREQIRIWPGMYAYENTVEVSGLEGNEKLLVGLVNSRTDKPLIEIPVNKDWVILMTHDLQTYEKNWWLGMALILPKSIYQGYLEAPKTGILSTSYFAKLDIQNQQPIKYFAAAGWELSNTNFTDSLFFATYVQDLALQLSTDVTIQVK